MKLKPLGGSTLVTGRIDGVMYGTTPAGTVGIVWPYPLSSPSFTFTTANNSIRSLDQNWQYLTGDKRSEWEIFVDECEARELCLLWYLFGSFRTPDEAAKSGYINTNVWRSIFNRPQSDTPPVGDLLPAGDSVTLVNDYPFTVRWNRPGGTPLQSTYMAIWAKVFNTRPSRDISPRKFKYLTSIGMTMNEDGNIQNILDQFLPQFKGCFIQVGLAAGMIGSCPFASFQVGAYTPTA